MENSFVFVPVGTAPNIDGTMSPGEWDQAALETFTDGSQLFLMKNGEFLYVGIRAKEPGTIAGNVFIQRGDEISILHSSAALGTAIYQKSETAWLLTRDFTWRCRKTNNSEISLAERANFLQEEGWLAANGLMGTPNELECQIRIPAQDFRLAVVYIKSTYPYEKVPWPALLDDDSIQPASGGLPPGMQFSPEQWAVLDISR